MYCRDPNKPIEPISAGLCRFVSLVSDLKATDLDVTATYGNPTRHNVGVGIAESMDALRHKNQETRMSTHIGQTIFVKGQLSASEDIQIAGRLEGDIQLNEHVLTVQPTAKLTAGVLAKSVVVQGDVLGDIVAGLNITLQNTASVSGRISAPSIAINDGANFNGRVETAFPKA